MYKKFWYESIYDRKIFKIDIVLRQISIMYVFNVLYIMKFYKYINIKCTQLWSTSLILDSFVTLDRVNNLHSPLKFYKSPEKIF